MSATTQLITGFWAASSTAVGYHIPYGGGDAQSIESQSQGIISTPGVIKNLKIKLSAAPGVGGSGKKYNITLYKNGSPTSLTVELLETATTGVDLSNQISVVAGDTITIEVNPTNFPDAITVFWNLSFVPTTSGDTILLSTSGGNNVLANNFIPAICYLSSSNESTVQFVVPCDGTLKNLYIKVNTAPGGVSNYVFTVRKGGINQILVVTLTGTATTGNDTVNSFAVVAGDLITIRLTKSSGNNPKVQVGMTFVPTTVGQFILAYLSNSENLIANNYIGLCSLDSSNATEVLVNSLFSACTIKNLYVRLTVAPGASRSRTFTLNKNTSPQTLTVTISTTSTAGNATTDISVADDDLLDTLHTISVLTPATSKASISYTGFITPIDTIQETINSDVHFKQEEIQESILSNVHFHAENTQESITSDVAFTNSILQTINSDVHFKSEGIQETINSDVYFVRRETILSDVHFQKTEQETILSDTLFVIEAIYNINNKVSFVKQVLSNVNNKVNTVKRVLKDVTNFINTVKSVSSNITNDFRTKKQPLYNVNNDVRFLKSWQQSGDYGFQSLGKSYIRVYIGGIEQTDVDVDSIKIYKTPNQSKTASFDLGRAYDGTLPTIEALVLIKYSDWIQYRGYITSFSPASDPESITVNCQDEFWKQNKTNKYFFVGHKPTDDKELYYDTIKEAISTEFSWTLPVGYFVPEVISCFGEGQSDILSNLIQQTGNYGFFYDETGTKQLYESGSGSTIDIQKQSIGTNIDLYQLIKHKYNKDVSNIVNKLRVQMGDKVIRKFNTTGGSRTYTGYNYASYIQYVTPAWDAQYEVLSKNSGTGEGFDKHSTTNDELYRDVFRKFHLPFLNPELSSWSDRYPPYVEIYVQYWSIFNAPIAILKDGFTIDYENKTITFNDPIFLYQTDANGECTDIRAPVVRVFLWKKDYYTFTEDPSDDPETDISNPLMFFTNKIGSYAETIIKELNLSQLSIQVGGLYQNLDGTTELIPSWDDIDFAEDLAYWQLSKTSYEKITIDIELTLDAVCFYNLTLDKRININGITDGAMNIVSMNYDMSNFTVSIQLERLYPYTRTISLPSRGE